MDYDIVTDRPAALGPVPTKEPERSSWNWSQSPQPQWGAGRRW